MRTGMQALESSVVESPYRGMELVTQDDYETFVSDNKKITVEDSDVKLLRNWRIKTYAPPSDYKVEHTTVWSFPDRGDWATHAGNYRGNWSPYIPRNLILKYTKPGELVLDQMVGSGTTLVECKLLGRNAVGVDINRNSIMVARDRLNFPYTPLDESYAPPTIKTYVGDARNLSVIDDDSIDLVVTHPPYASIIRYSKSKKVDGDISTLKLSGYLASMKQIAIESLRVLRPGNFCAILIGDTRQHRHFVPISLRVLHQFLDAGFILKEDIIKRQWNTKTTREQWRGRNYEFFLIAHEHLFVFRKPRAGENLVEYKNSAKWWM